MCIYIYMCVYVCVRACACVPACVCKGGGLTGNEENEDHWSDEVHTISTWDHTDEDIAIVSFV